MSLRVTGLVGSAAVTSAAHPNSPHPHVPDRSTATAAELLEFARSVGIAEADLPKTLPEPWRRLNLAGGYNFRDAGGYAGLGGRHIRRGMLWRSDHMNDLTDEDLTTLDSLDLRVIHDFRIDSEVAKQPTRLSTARPPKVIRLVMGDVSGSEAAIGIIADVMSGKLPAPAPDFWNDNYLDMLERGRHMFVGLFESLASPDSLPSLYHCTGGKDRTGIASVLLHSILGVDREVAINDFLLTNVYRTPFRVVALAPTLRANGVDPISMIPVLGVVREAIEIALNALDTTYGGPEQYLIGGGLPAEALDQLRVLLLE